MFGLGDKMPIYEYKCPKCGTVVEKLLPMSAEWHGRCEVCAANNKEEVVQMERIASSSSFVLKGSGWTPKMH